MAREKDTPAGLPEEPGGTLADAISAHLDLKREHGADPAEIEQEQREALAPPRRDTEPPNAPPAEPPAPEPASPPAAVTEPPPVAEPEPEPEPEPASEPSPAVQQMAAQDTGTFEFEWGDESSPPEPEPEPTAEPTAEPTSASAAKPSPDVLEQTPEFFEETPEYDKLWFEERPPREFDF